VEFVLVLTIVFIKIFFRNLLKIIQVIRAFYIHTLVNDEVFAVFLMNKSMAAVRTSKNIYLRESTFGSNGETRLTYFAQELTLLLAVVPHEVVIGGVALRAGTVSGNITFTMSEYRLDGLAISFLIVGNKICPVPFLLVRNNLWKLVDLKFLILWRVGIIKIPLLKRYIFADKTDQPAILFIKMLN